MRYFPIPLSASLLLFVSLADAGEIRGVVLGSDGNTLSEVTVVLCDRDTGIPVSADTFRPFIDKGVDLKNIAADVTDANGKFSFKDVPDGEYRLVSQNWRGKRSVRNIFEVNGKEIVLRGVAALVSVTSPEARNFHIRPLGNASVTIDEKFFNDDGLLLISTKPLAADPVLGFVSWRGRFLQNLIGANVMPSGFTTIHGLPEGRVHLSVFANDNNGAIGAGSVETRANETVAAEYIRIVCSWSNGRHEPPKELERTFSEIKRIAAKENNDLFPFLDGLLTKAGIVVRRTEKMRNPSSPYYPHLDVIVSLPSGNRVRFADVLASVQYIELQKRVERRKRRSNQTNAGDDK